MERHLIEVIYQEMTSDMDGDARQSERLIRLYQEAGEIGKWHIDEAMMALCGWTMQTLIEKAEKATA